MTDIITATSLKDVPLVSKVYWIGKNDNPALHVVEQCLLAYESKYHKKPERAVIYKQYLYVELDKIEREGK